MPALGRLRAGSPPPDPHSVGAVARHMGNRAAGRLLAAPDPRVTARRGFAGSGSPLPHVDTIQKSFGRYDISGVRGYTGGAARAANETFGSEAFTRGEQVAFRRPTSLHIAAHEAAHVLQQRAGLRLPGGVGRHGDRHECFADKVAATVTAGRSAEGLLDRAVGARARRAGPSRHDAPVQMYDQAPRKDVLDRIKARGGKAVWVGMEDLFYTGDKGQGLVGHGVASMARDPRFEMAAQRFEAGLAALAYNHPLTVDVCKRGAARVLAYLDAKHARSLTKMQDIDGDLKSMGISDPGWSGAVGRSARAVRDVLEKGSVMERVAHIEVFVRDILAKEVMEDETDWRDFAETAGLDMDRLREAHEKVALTGDRYLVFDTDKKSATGMQWHTRAPMEEVRKKGGEDKLHPSSVKKRLEAPEVPENPEQIVRLAPPKPKGGDESITTRDREHIELPSPLGMGVDLGEGEKVFQKLKSGGDDKQLGWVEGARVFALNELDKWVWAQRQFSLPLVAGTSSTAARIMQSFRFLGIGPADDARLAAIAAMLVGRHHSLVEVMEAGKSYGASPYREGPAMYRDIAPITDRQIADAGLEYPDAIVDPYDTRGGYSVSGISDERLKPENIVERDDEIGDEPVDGGDKARGILFGLDLGDFGKLKPKGKPRAPTLSDEVEDYVQKLERGIGTRPRAFVPTRATIKSTHGIWNLWEKRNSAQARMLRAVDAYHASTTERDKLASLRTISKQVDQWFVKHSGRTYHANKTIKGMKAIRAEAQLVLSAYERGYLDSLREEAAYLRKLGTGGMIAESLYVEKSHDGVVGGGFFADQDQKALIERYGLTLGEVTAIKVYSGPAYKFINTALEDTDRLTMKERLMAFMREIKTSEAVESSASERIKQAEQKRQMLLGMDDPVKAAKEEGALHAGMAIRGLQKLPPYTEMVYAGGAITRSEALARFKTGDVQERKAFSSTSRKEAAARNFTEEKGVKLQQVYESVPQDERQAGDAPFPFMLRYKSKTGRHIRELSVSKLEDEVLFMPGSKLRIVKGADSPEAQRDVTDFDNVAFTYIDAEEVV